MPIYNFPARKLPYFGFERRSSLVKFIVQSIVAEATTTLEEFLLLSQENLPRYVQKHLHIPHLSVEMYVTFRGIGYCILF